MLEVPGCNRVQQTGLCNAAFSSHDLRHAPGSPRRRVATAKLTPSRGYVRFDHVIVGGVEDVAADDPHEALVHHRLVGGSGQAGAGVLLPAPEGGVGRNGDGAVGTWGGEGRRSVSVRALMFSGFVSTRV